MFFNKFYVSVLCGFNFRLLFFFHDFIMFNLKETKRQT